MVVFRKTIFQSMLIIIISITVAMIVNGIRPNGLSVFQVQQRAMTMPVAFVNISLKDANELFASNNVVFVDARSQFEYEQGHIMGAISLPVEQFDGMYLGIKSKLQGKEVIVTYCDGERCPLGEELAKKLKDQGVQNVFVLKNGWTLWNNERLPVENE